MPINITDPKLEQTLRQEAETRGVSVTVVLVEALALYRRNAEWREKAEESDRMLEAAADEVSGDVPPLSDEAMSRESIYSRHHER